MDSFVHGTGGVEAAEFTAPVPQAITRRRFMRRAGLVAAALPFGATVLAACGSDDDDDKGSASSGTGRTETLVDLTPDRALALLKEGNARYVAQRAVDPNLNKERRLAVAGGQKPWAGVIGCVDSRVPPELVFDRGLGDLFVARVAGAIADNGAVGSMEFGVEEFHIPLLVVMGHQNCGAVKATIEALESGASAPGQIGGLVTAITPSVKESEKGAPEGSNKVDRAVRQTVRDTVAALMKSPVLAEPLGAGRLKIVGAHYSLDSGGVEFFA